MLRWDVRGEYKWIESIGGSLVVAGKIRENGLRWYVERKKKI